MGQEGRARADPPAAPGPPGPLCHGAKAIGASDDAAIVEALGSDGSGRLSVESDGASGKPTTTIANALGSDGGGMPSVQPDRAVGGQNETKDKALGSGDRGQSSWCTDKNIGDARLRDDGTSGALLAGRDLRRDQGALRGAASPRGECEAPQAKRLRKEVVQTREQLLRSLGGVSKSATREDERPGDADRRSHSLIGDGNGPQREAEVRGDGDWDASSSVTNRQQLIARLRAVGGGVARAPSVPPPLRRDRPGGELRPAGLAAARHAAPPRYPSTDPRATRPG